MWCFTRTALFRGCCAPQLGEKKNNNNNGGNVSFATGIEMFIATYSWPRYYTVVAWELYIWWPSNGDPITYSSCCSRLAGNRRNVSQLNHNAILAKISQSITSRAGGFFVSTRCRDGDSIGEVIEPAGAPPVYAPFPPQKTRQVLH